MSLDLKTSADGLSVTDLEAQYKEMIRNASVDQIEQIQASGPLSDNTYIRVRQEAYRQLLKLQSGVELSEGPEDILYHRV